MEDKPPISITPAMMQAGRDAVLRWADRYGVEDLPAISELVRMTIRGVLLCNEQPVQTIPATEHMKQSNLGH